MSQDKTQDTKLSGEAQACLAELRAAMSTFDMACDGGVVYVNDRVGLSSLKAQLSQVLHDEDKCGYAQDGASVESVVLAILKILEARPMAVGFNKVTDVNVEALPMTDDPQITGTWKIMHDLAEEALDVIRYPNKEGRVVDVAAILDGPEESIKEPVILPFTSRDRGHSAG